MATSEIRDIPAVSVGVEPNVFVEISSLYELFTRPGTKDMGMLDATGMSGEDLKPLGALIGHEAAEDCSCQYVVFYVSD